MARIVPVNRIRLPALTVAGSVSALITGTGAAALGPLAVAGSASVAGGGAGDFTIPDFAFLNGTATTNTFNATALLVGQFYYDLLGGASVTSLSLSGASGGVSADSSTQSIGYDGTAGTSTQTGCVLTVNLSSGGPLVSDPFTITIQNDAYVAAAWPRYPDASSTGYLPTGVSLTAYSGSMTISSPTTIDSKTITGTLTIASSGVTISRCKVNGRITMGYNSTYNPTIEDTEVNNGNASSSAVGDGKFTGRRLNIYGCGQGVNSYAFDLQDSYIHDLYGEGTDHSECMLGFSADTITVKHNRMEGFYGAEGTWTGAGGISSCVSFYTHDSWGDMTGGVDFQRNFMSTGVKAASYTTDRGCGGYTLYAGSDTGALSNGTWRDCIFLINTASSNGSGRDGDKVSLALNNGSGNCWTSMRLSDGTPIAAAGIAACA